MNHLSHCLIHRKKKKHPKQALFFPLPCVCVIVTIAKCHHNLFPELLGPISKVPGDQLALEAQWCGCGDNLLKLRKECYKQTGPQEHQEVPPGCQWPLAHQNKPWQDVCNTTLMAIPVGVHGG